MIVEKPVVWTKAAGGPARESREKQLLDARTKENEELRSLVSCLLEKLGGNVFIGDDEVQSQKSFVCLTDRERGGVVVRFE